ncbi:MAG: hypothetical protein ACKVOW_03505 [Chitinophagaceae bacterium]
MEQQSASASQSKDFKHSWVNSSVFLFYLQVLLFIAFTFGCAFSLYTKSYKGRPEVTIQPSSEYTPKYK